ncbi:MAG: hypothetical protein ACI30A_00085 [Paludibacteraceae bacterium]
MKKLFFFAAALVAAIAVNAQAQGFDGRDGTLGTQIYAEGVEANSLVQNRINVTLSETDITAHKYEIKVTVGGECSFTMGGVEFWYQNSNDGNVAYKTYNTYIQPNGNKRKVTIPVVAGKTIKIGVQDAITVAAEGASTPTIELQGWGADKDVLTELTPATGAATIVLWSDLRDNAYTQAKFKLGAVIYETNGETALSNTKDDAVKAQKMMVDGQLVILKNGKKFNALGAPVK